MTRGDDRQSDRHADSKAEARKYPVSFHVLSLRRWLFASCRPRCQTLDRHGDLPTERLEHLVQGHHHGFIVAPTSRCVEVHLPAYKLVLCPIEEAPARD